jgi:hypothetical protein
MVGGRGMLGWAAVVLSTNGVAYADDSSTAPLDTVVVQDKALTAQEAARAHLSEVPGGTSLITSEVFEKGRVSSTSDILAFQPGVFAQTAQGSDGLKISIRGSGINRGTGFFRSGTQFILMVCRSPARAERLMSSSSPWASATQKCYAVAMLSITGPSP